MRSTRIVPAVLVAGALILSGCSSSESGTGSPAGSGSGGGGSSSAAASPKPDDATTFVTDSLDAFEQAPSAHVSGSGSDNGDTITLDIKYGKDVAIGDLTLSGQQIEVSKIADGTTYFRAGADFWTTAGVPADAVDTYADKYVEVTADSEGFSDFAMLLDRSQFTDQFRPSDSDLTGAEVTGPTDVDGVSCYGIVDSDGKGAFYAAADGTPYPVQLKSGDEGEFEFDGYGDAVDVPTPDPADVVQLPGS